MTKPSPPEQNVSLASARQWSVNVLGLGGGAQRTAGKRWTSQGRGSVFSAQVCAFVCVEWGWGQKAQISSENRVLSSPKQEGTHSRAAWVVYDQCDVKAVHLQQVDQEGAIALGIQPHGPHVISGESRIDAPRDLRNGLEDAVVEFHEKSKMGAEREDWSGLRF